MGETPAFATAHFDVSNYRYRFWYLFPNGEMLETAFALPGKLSPEDANALACLYWANAVEQEIGGHMLPDAFQDTPFVKRRMSRPMAQQIIAQSSYEVLKPGETE